MKDQSIDKPTAGKLEGESGAGSPKGACIDSELSHMATLNYIRNAKVRFRIMVPLELISIFATVVTFNWWRNPNLFGSMNASLEMIRLISNFIMASIGVIMFLIVPIFWLLFFFRLEKITQEAALRWIEDGRIMELERCNVLELLAAISPEVRRLAIDRQGGDSEVEEFNLLHHLIDVGNSTLEREPILEENTKRIRALLSSVPQLTSLFHAHLATTVGITEKAAFAIMRQLDEVKAAAESLVGKLGSSNAKAQAMENTVQEAIAESHDLIASINGLLSRICG